MDKVITPVSNPDELRAEAAKVQLPSNPVAVNASEPIYNPAAMSPQTSSHIMATKIIMDSEKPKPLMGLYVLVGFIILGGIVSLFGSNTISAVAGLLTILIGAGLLLKNEIVRKLYIVLTSINLALSVMGLAFLLAVATNSKGLNVFLIAALSFMLQLSSIIYLSLPKVKLQFN